MHSVARSIGGTRLARLTKFEPRAGVEIFAKLESRNPGGSVKDRAALAMVLDGERSRQLGAGRVLIDASSGNTGIAYAVIGAARGHAVELCIPANASPERLRILRALGATVVLTDPLSGTDGAILEARRRVTRAPHRYYYPDQYANPLNWRAHYDSTGWEILKQTRYAVTHFVAGLGTTGTFIGTGRRLREAIPSITLVSAQPDGALHGLEGMKHMASAMVPPIYDPTLADRSLLVPTELALELTRRLAREAGIFVGPSSGAALAATLQVASDLKRGTIVTVFPDGGERYLSEAWWEEPESLVIPADVRRDIEQHARQAYPHECCGALIGQAGDAAAGAGGRVTVALSLDNVTTLERRRRFLVSPEAYRAAEAHADATRQRLIGFYHSHPDHPAVPSAFDLEQAWPNLSYVIASVTADRINAIRSWRLQSDRTQFNEEPVQGDLHVREDSHSHSVAALHGAGLER